MGGCEGGGGEGEECREELLPLSLSLIPEDEEDEEEDD